MHSTSLLGLLKETSYLRLRLMLSAEGLVFLNEIFGFDQMSKIRLRSYSALLAYDPDFDHIVNRISIRRVEKLNRPFQDF